MVVCCVEGCVSKAAVIMVKRNKGLCWKHFEFMADNPQEVLTNIRRVKK